MVKVQMVKITLFLSLVLILFSYATVCAKTFVLVTLESPPAEYSENGKPRGINIEIAREALRRMQYESKIVFVPWARALSMVKNGTADGIIDAAKTRGREEYLFFPDQEIYVEEWYCFKRRGSSLTLDKDFANASDIRLGISRGFVYGGAIQKAIDDKMFMSIEEVYNNELNIDKLVSKRFDMFVGVKATILFLAKKKGHSEKIEIVKMSGTNDDYLLSSSKTYLGFAKKTTSREIAEKFSKVVAEMKNDGTVAEILASYR